MKIRFYCDSGANIKSCKWSDWIGVGDDWKGLSDDDRYKEAEEWAWNAGLDIGYEIDESIEEEEE